MRNKILLALLGLAMVFGFVLAACDSSTPSDTDSPKGNVYFRTVQDGNAKYILTVSEAGEARAVADYTPQANDSYHMSIIPVLNPQNTKSSKGSVEKVVKTKTLLISLKPAYATKKSDRFYIHDVDGNDETTQVYGKVLAVDGDDPDDVSAPAANFEAAATVAVLSEVLEDDFNAVLGIEDPTPSSPAPVKPAPVVTPAPFDVKAAVTASMANINANYINQIVGDANYEDSYTPAEWYVKITSDVEDLASLKIGGTTYAKGATVKFSIGQNTFLTIPAFTVDNGELFIPSILATMESNDGTLDLGTVGTALVYDGQIYHQLEITEVNVGGSPDGTGTATFAGNKVTHFRTHGNNYVAVMVEDKDTGKEIKNAGGSPIYAIARVKIGSSVTYQVQAVASDATNYTEYTLYQYGNAWYGTATTAAQVSRRVTDYTLLIPGYGILNWTLDCNDVEVLP